MVARSIRLSSCSSLLGSLVVSSIISCSSDTEKVSDRPNIVFIFTDQQNVKAISAHGNSYLHTPCMDSLVNNGVSFLNSYCTSPVCAPSRSSLITGLMPHSTGVNYNGESIKDSIPNVGELLEKAGYKTIWAGKWHLVDPYPARTKDTIRGFKLLKFYNPDSSDWELGSKTDRPLADAAVNYIENYDNSKPLFLCISFHNPHDICYFPRRPEKYPNPVGETKLPPLPVNHSIEPDEPDLPANSRTRDHYGNELLLSQKNDETRWRSYLWYYYRRTEEVDTEIGKVLHALKVKGMDKNTLIVFSSDHGDGMAEKKWAAKLSLNDASAKVPFVLCYNNKIPASGINDNQLVSGIDMVPTILDYAGAKIPENLPGISLKKIINNPGLKQRDCLITELAVDQFDKSLTGRMVRTDQYKYIVYSIGEKREELYDMHYDPFEMENLDELLDYQTIKNHMKNKLKGWVELTEDPFVDLLIP